MKPQENIDYIIANFDWGKVHRTMVALDWRWSDNEIPTIGKLVQQATNLLQLAVERASKLDSEEATCETATGGFRAIAWKDGHCKLQFCIEDWDSFE